MDMDPDEMERKAVEQLGPFYKWLWGWSKLGCAPISPQQELWTKLEGWKPVLSLRVILPEGSLGPFPEGWTLPGGGPGDQVVEYKSRPI